MVGILIEYIRPNKNTPGDYRLGISHMGDSATTDIRPYRASTDDTILRDALLGNNPKAHCTVREY